MNPLIVTVEDDSAISELVEFNLQNEGYSVLSFRDGRSMLEQKYTFGNPALFILDIMLPEMDGFEICAKIKQIPQFEMTPVIMLTAKSSETDKVKALDIGADDYITKPFGFRELLSRVNLNITRYIKITGGSLHNETVPDFKESSKKSSAVVSYAGIRLDDPRCKVYKNKKEIEMTHMEYELLKFLMNHPGIAYSRNTLLVKVWGNKYLTKTRTVDVHIRQLRIKIEDDDTKPRIIETVRGRGYRFAETNF